MTGSNGHAAAAPRPARRSPSAPTRPSHPTPSQSWPTPCPHSSSNGALPGTALAPASQKACARSLTPSREQPPPAGFREIKPQLKVRKEPAHPAAAALHQQQASAGDTKRSCILSPGPVLALSAPTRRRNAARYGDCDSAVSVHPGIVNTALATGFFEQTGGTALPWAAAAAQAAMQRLFPLVLRRCGTPHRRQPPRAWLPTAVICTCTLRYACSLGSTRCSDCTHPISHPSLSLPHCSRLCINVLCA
jgi:hypothetical protein